MDRGRFGGNQLVSAVIVAAGRGERLGVGEEKAFLHLWDRPILAHALQPFAACACVAEIVVVASAAGVSRAEDLVHRWGIGKVARIVEGGAHRCDSVLAGVAATRSDAAYIAVHDAARPLLAVEELEQVIAAAEQVREGGAILAAPVKPTIKQVNAASGLVEATVRRDRLWEAQTPQVFPRALLLEAYRRVRDRGDVPTDEAAAVEALGRPVRVVPGSYRNVKITTPEDLAIAEALLAGGAYKS